VQKQIKRKQRLLIFRVPIIANTEKRFFIGHLHYCPRVYIPKMEVLSRERAVLQDDRKQGANIAGLGAVPWGASQSCPALGSARARCRNPPRRAFRPIQTRAGLLLQLPASSGENSGRRSLLQSLQTHRQSQTRALLARLPLPLSLQLPHFCSSHPMPGWNTTSAYPPPPPARVRSHSHTVSPTESSRETPRTLQYLTETVPLPGHICSVFSSTPDNINTAWQ